MAVDGSSVKPPAQKIWRPTGPARPSANRARSPTGRVRAVQAGARVDRYVIESELGAGGFGTVYRARHTVIDRPVALKLLRRDRDGSPQVLDRFLQEARAAAAVGSPHIVQVLDAGVTPDGQAFLAMELLDGESLDDLLGRRGRLSPDEAAEILGQILAGLGAAHAHGIVHRDLKPANVFVARDPSGAPLAKILDFGISKVHGASRLDALTRTGMVLGTPCYMAPEQLRDAKAVDARADLYACAVILYELLSGRLPFVAETYEALILRVFTEPPTPLEHAAPGTPAPLVHLVERGLAREPDARWQSAEEMARALEAARSGAPTRARDTGPLTDPRALAPTQPSRAYVAPTRVQPSTGAPSLAARTPQPVAGPVRRSGASARWIAVAIAALLGAGLAAGGVVAGLAVLSSPGRDAERYPPPPATEGLVTREPARPAAVADPKAALDPPPAAQAAPAPQAPAAVEPPPAARREAPTEPAPPDPPSADPAPRASGRIRARVEVLGDSIPYDEAQRVVDRAIPRMERCREPGAEHRVRAQMLVGIGGRIATAQPDPNRPHGDTDVARCVAEAIRAESPVGSTEMGGIFYANLVLPPAR